METNIQNMHDWLKNILELKTKKPMPILTFPSVQLMGITVDKLISDSNLQAQGMKLIADRVDSLAAVSYMDLSLEAEAFGCSIKKFEMEVPTVIGTLVNDLEEAKNLKVPSLDSGRIPIYLDSMTKALEMIKDRPVFAGVIGPFSLTGRIVDVNKAFLYCKKNPELLHEILNKATEFLIGYIKAYKKIGVHGIVMAEPLTGMLSPKFAQEFSEPYVRRIAEEVKSDDFIVIYHNCGNVTTKMKESILATNCDAFHFGNAIDIKEMLDFFPEDKLVMGNIDPAAQFNNGSPESMGLAVDALLGRCGGYKNFVISSGCDIPPTAKWENIDEFFKAVSDFNFE